MRFAPTLRPHERWSRLVDTYADRELSGRDRQRFETHLASCPRCTAAVASARDLKRALTVLPTVTTTRSFRLTAAMVAGPAIVPAPSRGATPLRLAQGLASVAIVAFAAVVTVDLLGDGDSSDDGGQAAATSQDQVPVSASAAAPSPSDTLSDSATAPVSNPAALPTPFGNSVGGQANPAPIPSETPALESRSSAPESTGDQPYSTAAAPDKGYTAPATDQQALDAESADDSDTTDLRIVELVLAAVAAVALGAVVVLRRRRNETGG